MLLNEIDWKRLIEHGEIQDVQEKSENVKFSFVLVDNSEKDQENKSQNLSKYQKPEKFQKIID